MDSSNTSGRNELDQAKLLLDHCQFEYNDLSDTWRDIERKAQGEIAIVGIFLIGGLTFLRFFIPENLVAFGLIALSMAILVVSALLAISALLVDEVETVQPIGDVREFLKSCSGEDALRAYLDRWEIVNTDLSNKNYRKSAWVLRSQYALMGGVIGLAIGVLVATACGISVSH